MGLLDEPVGQSGAVKMMVRSAIAVAAVGLFWAGLAYNVSKPTDASGYLRTALQAAASAHDGANTGVLIGRQQLEQQVFPAFAVSAYDDARRALAGAQKKLADTPPPDDASAALRDRLAPLVQAAVHDLGDAARASDDAILRAAVDALHHDAERLGNLIEQHQ
jgi:hypothetical protein